MEIVKDIVVKDQWLQLNSEIIKELEKEGKEAFEADYGTDPKDRKKGELTFGDVSLDIDEMYYEKGILNCSFTMKYNSKELGYLGLYIPLDRKIVLSIIEAYMKKLGKVKTVLEATKDF